VVAETFEKHWNSAILFFFIRATSKSILNPDPSFDNQGTSVEDPDSVNPDPDPAFQVDTDPGSSSMVLRIKNRKKYS
jgi:hypothetical protein